MAFLRAHPQKHLIRDLWPDKHLYASLLIIIASVIGGLFAIVAYAVPVTLSNEIRTNVAGWNWPFGILLPAIALPLAIASYRLRRPWIGFVAAGIEIASIGALGIATLLALVAVGFLLKARAEGEHENPATRELHPHHWPDKSLGAALLFAVAGVSLLVWGGMLLSDSLYLRGIDVRPWGAGSVLAGLLALAAAFLCYRQRSFGACVGAAVVVGLSLGFVVVGPALAVGAAVLLMQARREGEFG